MDVVTYPRLLRRVQAVLIDSLVIVIIFYFCVITGAYLDLENPVLKTIYMFAPSVSIEPVMIAMTGSSIGHHFIGLKVRHINSDKNINIFLAYIRFSLKFLFGIPSLIFVLTTRKHQAVHDMLTKAIVIHKNPSAVPINERLEERTEKEKDYRFPSKVRRTLIILLYMFFTLVLMSILSVLFVSEECLLYDSCSNSEDALTIILSFVWWGSIFILVFLGWSGKLLGCRKTKL